MKKRVGRWESLALSALRVLVAAGLIALLTWCVGETLKHTPALAP